MADCLYMHCVLQASEVKRHLLSVTSFAAATPSTTHVAAIIGILPTSKVPQLHMQQQHVEQHYTKQQQRHITATIETLIKLSTNSLMLFTNSYNHY